jgi:hypothetical protein
LYVALDDGRVVRPFSARIRTIPVQLPPGFPILFHVDLEGLSRVLVNEGCRGTARVDLIVRDGTGKLHKKSVEIPLVEDMPEGQVGAE